MYKPKFVPDIDTFGTFEEAYESLYILLLYHLTFREDDRGVAGVALATPFFQDLFYMPSRLLTIWSSGHPVIRTSGHPVFWPSGHLVIRPSGHPAFWSSRLLAI